MKFAVAGRGNKPVKAHVSHGVIHVPVNVIWKGPALRAFELLCTRSARRLRSSRPRCRRSDLSLCVLPVSSFETRAPRILRKVLFLAVSRVSRFQLCQRHREGWHSLSTMVTNLMISNQRISARPHRWIGVCVCAIIECMSFS